MKTILQKFKTRKFRFSIIVIAAVLLFFGIKLIFVHNELTNNGIYTVGEVTGIRSSGSRGWEYLQYTYKVDGTIYKGEYGEIGSAKIGHQYLVLYSEKSVYLNLIYPDKLMDNIELGTKIGKYDDLKLPIYTWDMPYLYNSPPD